MKGWLKFEFRPELISEFSFTYCELMRLIFSLRTETCKNQSRCISHLIISTAGNDSPSMEPTKLAIGSAIFSLIPSIKISFTEKNYTMIDGFQLIFATLGKSYTDKLILNPDLELYDIMLKLLSYPGENLSSLCQFWKGFFQQIEYINKKDRKIEELKDLFKNSLLAICDLMKIPKQVFVELNELDSNNGYKEIFERRNDYGRIIKYIGICIGKNNSWKIINTAFEESIEKLPINIDYWITIDALLSSLSFLLVCIF